MKKLLLTALVMGATALSAQTTGHTTLNVKLHPIMSISVNQPLVAFDIDTEDEYINGAQTTVLDHIRTFSTVAYQVNVKSLNPTLSKPDDAIELNKVTITASSSFPHATYTPAVLSESGAPLIESTRGGGQKSHNVTYSIGSGLWDNEMGEYSATVQYEIVAL